jgi:ATP adenylyltransferase
MQSGAYNLLFTREWMLIVPRKQEEFEKISVNSLGFAGALLVKNQQQMQLLKNINPINLLNNVAFPRQQN